MKKFGLAMLAAALVVMFAACDNGTTGDGGVKVPPLTGDIVPGSNLAAKLAWLRTNAESGKSYIIEINADESTGPVELSYGGKSITIGLRGVGANRTVSLSSNGTMFTIQAGVTLVLDGNITLKGRAENGTNLIDVSSRGTLVMNPDAILTENTGGAGVFIRNYGTFTMNGGAISNNGTNGVLINRDGVFNMAGGTISGNGFVNEGRINPEGVFLLGTFNMSGGTISGNAGWGVMIAAPGSPYGTFTMSGGTISSNGVGGLQVHGVIVARGGTFTMSGGTISEHTNSGVMIDYGAFTMSGGIISGNGNSGVRVLSEGTFTMSGGTITGNSSWAGGGVWNRGTFTKTGGTITGSNANNGNRTTSDDKSSAVSAAKTDGTGIKSRDTTAGPRDNLFFNGDTGEFTGAWDE